MPQVISSDVDALRAAVIGQVVLPGDPAYDEARRLWNGWFDQRPAVVVRCTCAADVSAAIGFARERGLEIAVRGGGHSTGGMSSVDGGLMIDLSPLDDVEVDAPSRRCRVGGGATLGTRDAATQKFALATTAGIVSHTGVGGLTLGGGMGWLTRKHGLSLDNLVSAEMVTADGRIRVVSADTDPDLFWAVRGGGGNFGVVTSFEFALHPVGPMVDFGFFHWPLEQLPAVFRLVHDLFATMSTDLNLIVAAASGPPLPFVPVERHGTPGATVLLTGFDAEDEHAAVVARIRAELPPVAEMVAPTPYLAVQQLLDESNHPGIRAYDKSTYVEDFSDEAVQVIVDHLARKTAPGSALIAYRLDGAYAAVADDSTAFSGRRVPCYGVFILGLSEDAAGFPAEREWARSLWSALQPHAMGLGSYINGEAEHPEDRLRSSWGEAKYARLAAIKHRYDPDNLFHRNANVPPVPQPPQQREPLG